MLKYLLVYAALFSINLGAYEKLENLVEYDKSECLQILEKASDSQLWDVFLKGQTNLFSQSESAWLANQSWWTLPQKVLEIGCGNGAYLDNIARNFPMKSFQGVEKLPEFVEKANTRFANENLLFLEGDAEVYDPRLEKSADIVLFRLALQHIQNPNQALKNAATYLKPGGRVLIIDSFDKAHKTYPPAPTIDNAMELAAESQKKKSSGNRKISFDLLQGIESKTSDLHDLFEVEFSTLDTQGNVVCKSIRIEGEENRLRFFNHMLLGMILFERTYQISVNLDKVYDELQKYLRDENAWYHPGMHYLVLKEK